MAIIGEFVGIPYKFGPKRLCAALRASLEWFFHNRTEVPSEYFTNTSFGWGSPIYPLKTNNSKIVMYI